MPVTHRLWKDNLPLDVKELSSSHFNDGKSNQELDSIVVFRAKQQTYVNSLSIRIIHQNQAAELAEKSVADSV